VDGKPKLFVTSLSNTDIAIGFDCRKDEPERREHIESASKLDPSGWSFCDLKIEWDFLFPKGCDAVVMNKFIQSLFPIASLCAAPDNHAAGFKN
jgi:hypothetical protein